MKPPTLSVRFFRTDTGVEPVRDWLKSLPAAERRTIGEHIKQIQYGWPLGIPLVRKMSPNHLWEARSHMVGRIARVLFTTELDEIVLLHGFIKKSQDTPQQDLKLARDRLKQIRSQS